MKGNQKSLGWCRSDELLRRLQLGLRRHSNRLQLLGVSLSPQNPTARLRAFWAKPSQSVQSVTCPSPPFLTEGIIFKSQGRGQPL